MLTTVIYAHPYENSYNKSILDIVIKSLQAQKREYALIDLYKDNFDPVLRDEELAVYSRGECMDPLVEKYNKILDETQKVIIIFPVWWYDFPAIMKGFFDKVMLLDSAFFSDEKGLHALRNIPQTLIITTSSAPTEALVNKLGNTINVMMIDTIFKTIGFNGAHWENFGSIGKSTFAERNFFLSRIATLI